MVAVGTKLQVKEQRRFAGNFVYEAATHTHGDIEVLNLGVLHKLSRSLAAKQSLHLH